MPQTSRANFVKRHSTFKKGTFYSKYWFANYRSVGTLLPQGLYGIIQPLQFSAQELYVCSKEPSIFRQRALYSLEKEPSTSLYFLEPSTSSKDQACRPCPSILILANISIFMCMFLVVSGCPWAVSWRCDTFLVAQNLVFWARNHMYSALDNQFNHDEFEMQYQLL